jgi:glycerol kinase
VWNKPDRYLSIFKRFAGVITPDFSLYWNMPLAMQIWNTYRNRALGYWLQNNGVPIVTNVSWGDERTYAFAFEGLAKGGAYAVSTNGCIRNKANRYSFIKGLKKMVEALEPKTIVNYPYYSKDIFERYEKRGIEIITLPHWSDSLKGGMIDG